MSSDASANQAAVACVSRLSRHNDLVVLKNGARLGIAGNSNRLLRCLSRFNHLLLLNDDVEILSSGWDNFYSIAAAAAGLKHMVFQQPGLYGGKLGEPVNRNGCKLLATREKPQGAVLYLTRDCLNTIGYMDERYGLYGMEHIDWSMRAWELAGQPAGFYDIASSTTYFKTHSEASAVQERGELLRHSKQLLTGRTPARIEPSAATVVPSVTYVLPFRNTGRSGAIKTVVENIRSQRYPVIKIILAEQDQQPQLDLGSLQPVEQ